LRLKLYYGHANVGLFCWCGQSL